MATIPEQIAGSSDECQSSYCEMLPTSIALRAVTKWPEGPSLDPHEVQAVYGWHCVGESGAWDIGAMCRDLASQLVHSHWSGTPVIPESPRKCRHLVFATEQDLFVAVSEHTPGYRVLRLWSRSAERAEEEFRKLRASYFREERSDSVIRSDWPPEISQEMRNLYG